LIKTKGKILHSKIPSKYTIWKGQEDRRTGNDGTHQLLVYGGNVTLLDKSKYTEEHCNSIRN
jgi:hypothetical protein